MQQVILQQPGELLLHDIAIPRPGEGEALVRIHRVGVCGTDMHAYHGRQPFLSYPRVLGHELGVEIVEIGENDRGLAVGDHCAVEPYITCGKCHSCSIGKTNCCENFQTLGVHTDGAMQPLFAVPIRLLHKSEKLSLDQLALVETLGVGAHAVRRGKTQPGQDVLVVGAGPIGLAAIQYAHGLGANVRVLELNERRRDFVAALGVEVLSEPDDQLAEVVIDATGHPQAMEASFERVAFGGTLVFVGFHKGDVKYHNPLFHRREMTVCGSRNSVGVIPTLIEMIEDGRIDTAPWITHRMLLTDVPDRFPKLSDDPSLVKAMIEVEG